MVVALVFIPGVFFWILMKPIHVIHRGTIKKRYGMLYEGVKTQSKSSLFQPVNFLLRRALYVATSFLLANHGGIQIMCLNYLNLAQMVFFGLFFPL